MRKVGERVMLRMEKMISYRCFSTWYRNVSNKRRLAKAASKIAICWNTRVLSIPYLTWKFQILELKKSIAKAAVKSVETSEIELKLLRAVFINMEEHRMQLIMYFIARMLRQHLARIFVQYVANVQNHKQFYLASIQFLKRMQQALVFETF